MGSIQTDSLFSSSCSPLGIIGSLCGLSRWIFHPHLTITVSFTQAHCCCGVWVNFFRFQFEYNAFHYIEKAHMLILPHSNDFIIYHTLLGHWKYRLTSASLVAKIRIEQNNIILWCISSWVSMNKWKQLWIWITKTFIICSSGCWSLIQDILFVSQHQAENK